MPPPPAIQFEHYINPCRVSRRMATPSTKKTAFKTKTYNQIYMTK